MRFPNNARVCFIGDSLVCQNETLPRIIDFYNRKFPANNIRFFNCGTSGGTYKTAIEFFKDDVLRHKPTHAVVAFGVNDSNQWVLEENRSKERIEKLKYSFEEYKKNVKTYCKLLQENNIEITLCTPVPYDEYTEGDEIPRKGEFALILGYAQFIREFAKDNELALCDYHDYITNELQVDKEKIYSSDRVHPLSHGYYLIAKCFLLHQGYELESESDIPEYFFEWREAVRRLRMIYGAEQMVVENYSMDNNEKIAFCERKIEKEDWVNDAFKPFIYAFVKDKPIQEELYTTIDELYERDILQH